VNLGWESAGVVDVGQGKGAMVRWCDGWVGVEGDVRWDGVWKCYNGDVSGVVWHHTG